MADMLSNFKNIAKDFVTYYYQVFDRNRAELAPLYEQNSLMTFQDEEYQGQQAIVQKLVGMPLQGCQHDLQGMKVNSQPLLAGGNAVGIMVFCAGNLITGPGEQPLKFAQSFVLQPNPSGSYFVANDIFTLNVG